MNEQPGRDPLDALRDANPVPDDRLSSASLARIRARVREDVMSTPSAIPTRRSFRLAGLAAGAVVAGALAVAVVATGRPASLGPAGSPIVGSAACVEQYSAGALVNRAFAFDGTVTAIDGERVVFEVNEAYKGIDASTVTVNAPGMTGTAITSAGGPNLLVGERYLVAGEAEFAWGCGFTQPYSEATASEWAGALAD